MQRFKMAGREHVSATQLAAMVTCEKRVLLTQLHGARTTPSQRAAMRRGIAVHALVAHSNDIEPVSSQCGTLGRFRRATRSLLRRTLKLMVHLLLGPEVIC